MFEMMVREPFIGMNEHRVDLGILPENATLFSMTTSRKLYLRVKPRLGQEAIMNTSSQFVSIGAEDLSLIGSSNDKSKWRNLMEGRTDFIALQTYDSSITTNNYSSSF